MKRRQFLKTAGAFVIAAGAGQRLPAAAPGEASWREKRLGQAQRRRRIIYNDDGDARYKGYYGGPPKDVADFLRRRFDWTRDTQVDSYFWCIGDGQEPPWGQPLHRGEDE